MIEESETRSDKDSGEKHRGGLWHFPEREVIRDPRRKLVVFLYSARNGHSARAACLFAQEPMTLVRRWPAADVCIALS